MLNKMLLLMAGLLALTGFFLWRLFGAEQILVHYHSVKQQLAQQQMKNTEQSIRNEKLLAEVNRLKSNSKALESEARQSLGMIKKDEVFYQITPHHDKREG